MTQRFRFLIGWLALLLLSSHSLMGQSVSEVFEEYQNSHHLEKVYINHDKPFYLLGDTIWCQALFVDGRTHQFFNAAPIVHVELLNDKADVIKTYLLKIDKGLAKFEIPTSYADEAGDYTLRAHTQYQRNFEQSYLFQKTLTVFSDSSSYNESAKEEGLNKFSAQFFPEGGNIIKVINNVIAVKVQNQMGKNLGYTGILLNDDGDEITTFKSYNEGIAIIEFTPQENTIYSAQVINNGITQSFPLPDILPKGYKINIASRSKEHIKINVESNTDNQLDGATLIGHIRGQLFLNQKLTSEATQQLKFLRSQIPSGILHFTLFDQKDRPVCERLTFNKNPEEKVSVDVGLEKSTFSKREQIELKVKTTQEDKIVPSSLSVSVYNQDVIPQGNNNLSIVNYLLLQSDLVGRINNINQYFQTDDTKSNFLIDLLMLTQGWRRFTWQNIQNKKLPIMEYATAEDLPIIGIVRKHNKDEPVKADVFLSILSSADFNSTTITTEEDGIFYFKGLELSDTTDVLIQANVHNKKKRKKLKKGESKRTGNDNVDIELLTLDPLVFDPATSINNKLDKSLYINDIVNEFIEIKRSQYLYHPEWSIDLDEVMIKGLRKTKRAVKLDLLKDDMKSRGMLYFPSSQKIFLDELPGGGAIYQDIYDVIRGRVPGVQIKGPANQKYIVIRNRVNIAGDIPATIMIDGLEVSNLGASQINVQDVKAIDVIKGLYATSVFGESGAGGVVSIITKNPEDRTTGTTTAKKVKGSLSMRMPGIFNAREFYSPNFAKKSIDNQQPMLNTTLYWKPMIRINKKAENISFYTGDRKGQYVIKIEGITEEGYPFLHLDNFTIGI